MKQIKAAYIPFLLIFSIILVGVVLVIFSVISNGNTDDVSYISTTDTSVLASGSWDKQTDVEFSVSDTNSNLESNYLEYDDKILYTCESDLRSVVRSYVESYSKENGYATCNCFDLIKVDDTEYDDPYVVVHMLFDDTRYVCICINGSLNVVPIYDCALTPRLISLWEYN